MRLVLHLLRQEPEAVESFADALTTLKHEAKFLQSVPQYFGHGDVPHLFQSPADASTVCVVENIRDVMAVEATQQYRGLYHVLGGVISPIDGIGAERPSDRQPGGARQGRRNQRGNPCLGALRWREIPPTSTSIGNWIRWE